MAYGKKFYTSYKSYNGWDYYMEIFIKNYVGADSEISLGVNGCVISYNTDNNDRDNSILSSDLSFDFLITNITEELFVSDLRDTWQEGDVYVHLYQSTSANENPLWSGFVLMDLGAAQDVSMPYKVELKATDGLSLLKSVDFVKDGSNIPYSNADIYSDRETFVYWISEILQKAKTADLSNGAFADPLFSTSVNWYNELHQDTTLAYDPLKITKGGISWANKVDDNEYYDVENCYVVLKEMLRVWGCRITYWNHMFHVVQISEYINADSGTNLNPDNLNTRIYNLNGTLSSTQSYLGNKYKTRYDLITGTGGAGIQKLTGTTYQFYPRLKNALATAQTGGGLNYYGGFPPFNALFLGNPIPSQWITNAASASELYLEIPLNVSKGNAGAYLNLYWRFNVVATDGTTTKYLQEDSGTFSWINTLPTFGSPSTERRIRGSCGLTSSVINQQKTIFSDFIPSDSAFAGTWKFTIEMDDSDWGTQHDTSFFQISTTGYGYATYEPFTNAISWSNIPQQAGGNEGFLLMINSNNGVNAQGQDITVLASADNSKIKDFGKLFWADASDGTDQGALEAEESPSFFTPTNFTGKWGIGTLLGDDTITNLLLSEFIFGQINNTQIINTKFAISENGKNDNDGTLTVPNYINPIGRIRENIIGYADKFYIFRSGNFHTYFDEWDYEGWEVKRDVETLTTTTTTTWGPNGPPQTDNGTIGLKLAAPTTLEELNVKNSSLTTTTSAITGVKTSIDIEAVGETIMAAGDVLLLSSVDQMHELTLSTRILSTDTSININSYDFGGDVILAGALITHNEIDLLQQYQNKTKGTVGGMAVSATTLGPIEYTAGRYIGNFDALRGEDLDYIIVLPSDFMINDDVASPAQFKDAATTGLQVSNASSELLAFIRIPTGKKATHVDIWGTNPKPVKIYEMNVNANTNLTTATDLAGGTGVMNTQITLSSEVDSTSTNYLLIRVTLTATSNRIWGGKVTIDNIII